MFVVVSFGAIVPQKWTNREETDGSGEESGLPFGLSVPFFTLATKLACCQHVSFPVSGTPAHFLSQSENTFLSETVRTKRIDE